MKYLFCFALAFIGGCDDQRSTQKGEPLVSIARPSRSIELEIPDRHDDRAFAALRRDAYRREERFLDALQPGTTWATTRVEQAEINQGRWTIKELYQMGGRLFDHSFTRSEGLGTRSVSHFQRVHLGDKGSIDALRCSACHWRGGEAGAGDAADNVYFLGDGDRPSSALERNPPSLVGLGAIELAAQTLSKALQAQRDQLISFTRSAGYAVRESLIVQGIHFGDLTVHADGSVNTEEVIGVDADLIVKPFGRKGQFSSIREMVEESLLIHHGLQTEWMVKNGPSTRMGIGEPEDPDEDGVIREITEGQVTALTLYLSLQGLPTIEPPEDHRLISKWGRGQSLFESVGCAGCHSPSITLETTTLKLKDRLSDHILSINLSQEGAQPRISEQLIDGQVVLYLFSDLKRHQMSEQMADHRSIKGIPGHTFITPPLWGLARSRPYMHDGRAPTIEDAILLHGGEAQRSQEAFVNLSEEDKGAIRIFLTSLNRAQSFTAR